MSYRCRLQLFQPIQIVAALTLLIITVTLQLIYLPYAEDDAYIHMRIARNLWQNGRPYYNPLIAVMGSTSPLWILLLAPLSLLGELMPLAVSILNSFIITATCLTWATIFSSSTKTTGSIYWILALLVAWGAMISASLSLMETPLALLLVGIAYVALSRKNTLWAIPVTLAVFTRPECLVFAVLFAIHRWREKRPVSLLEILAGVVPLAAFIAFELLLFGSIYPHTAAAKAIVYQITTAEFVKLLSLATFGSKVSGTILPCSVALITFLLCILPFTVSSGKSLQAKGSRYPDACIFLLASGIILTLYGVKHVLVFSWYTPLMMLPFYGAALWLTLSKSWLISSLGYLALLPLTATTALFVAGAFRIEFSPLFESGARAKHLLAIGRELQRSFPGRRIMAPEIGALGYTYTGEIIDGLGLVTPAALPFHPLAVPLQRPAGYIGAVPSRFAAQQDPDIILGLSSFLGELLSSNVAERYTRIILPPVSMEDLALLSSGKVFGSDHIELLIRKDLTPPSEMLNKL